MPRYRVYFTQSEVRATTVEAPNKTVAEEMAYQDYEDGNCKLIDGDDEIDVKVEEIDDNPGYGHRRGYPRGHRPRGHRPRSAY